MNVRVERSGNDWDSVSIELRTDEIESLVSLLSKLRAGEIGHFHIRNNDFSRESGLADIEFSKHEEAGDEYEL